MQNFRSRQVDNSHFAMIPRSDIPRSRFRQTFTHKTTFGAGQLIPLYLEEVLPGDSISLDMTVFARMATPIVPVMDNLHLESFFFFVPNRLLWSNWEKFMGEQVNPGDSISYVIPQVPIAAGGAELCTIFDYFGLPVAAQIPAATTYYANALPFRAYNLIYNEWFRDENLQNSLTVPLGDGPDTAATYVIRNRGKRKDYFTSALPWPQKGTALTILPNVGTFPQAPVQYKTGAAVIMRAPAGTIAGNGAVSVTGGGGTLSNGTTGMLIDPNGSLYADLSAVTQTTINQLRMSFQIQKLLERDARGGTRYTEIVRSHFGVISPDARLQRPEYLGGGSQMVNITPVAQTSATGVSGGTTPIASLSGVGTVLARRHGFSQSFTEHGYILGLVNVRPDMSYQYGIPKLFSRSTRYDFYFPAFAMLGEQAILKQELYTSTPTYNQEVFGYQERWSEYKWRPSRVTGVFRSSAVNTLDVWHYAQAWGSPPVLTDSFIQENGAPTVNRTLAVPNINQQFLCDAAFSVKMARPMPMYSVPGLVDHF